MAIRIDQTYLPLIVIKYDGPTSDADFEVYLEAMRASMYGPKAGLRVLLQDATLAYPITPKQRKRQAEWMKENAERLRSQTLGSAFVIPSGLMRGVLTAIFWIQPLPCPHEILATLPEALAWCAKKLEERGLSLPSGAVQKLG